MILVTPEIRAALRANDRTHRAAQANGQREPDPVPVVRFFNPVGTVTWLATEIDEDGIMWGLCRAQHKPNYVKCGVMLSWLQNAARWLSDMGGAVNITRMLQTSQDERSTTMSDELI